MVFRMRNWIWSGPSGARTRRHRRLLPRSAHLGRPEGPVRRCPRPGGRGIGSGWRRARADERTAWLCHEHRARRAPRGRPDRLSRRSRLGPFRTVDDLIFLPEPARALRSPRRRSGRLARATVTGWPCSTPRSSLRPRQSSPGTAWPSDTSAIPRSTTTARLVACAHPLVDVLVIGLSLRLVLTRDGRDRSTVSFAAGAMLLVGVQLLSTGLHDPGSVQAGSAASPVWLLSFLLIGFAALLPSDVPAIHSGMAMAMGRTRLLVVLARGLRARGRARARPVRSRPDRPQHAHRRRRCVDASHRARRRPHHALARGAAVGADLPLDRRDLPRRPRRPDRLREPVGGGAARAERQRPGRDLAPGLVRRG